MARPTRRFDPSVLLAPALIMLAVGFLLPIVWFLVSTLREIGGPLAIARAFADTLSSREVVIALITTNWIALLVTLVCLIVGYPIAYYMATASRLSFNLVLFCVIVPYFTSVIVRTYSWMVLLGRNGILNQALMALGLTQTPLALLYNKLGILIGMTYVLMPYMILTLYSAMKAIDPSYMRAAYALGASRRFAFFKVYLPLTWHGVVSGSLIVFILAIGFFITPALMGGPSDVMIAMLIERAVEITLDWPSAAVMAVVLLAVTMVLYAIYYKVTDTNRLLGVR